MFHIKLLPDFNLIHCLVGSTMSIGSKNIYYSNNDRIKSFNGYLNVTSIDDEVIIEKGGYDVMSFIRFYRLCFKILLCTSAYCWVVLLPINGFVFILQ